MSIVAFTHYRQAQSGDVLEDLVARGFPRNEPPRFRQPSCPKLFLDLFCGKNNPLCNAVLAMGGASVWPWDAHPFCMGPEADLLDPSRVKLLSDLAASGAVAFAAAAPPCSDYSVLRQLPDGPPPCRTADYMHGWPDMCPRLFEQMRLSYSLHEETCRILRMIHAKGGHFSWENPPSSLALRETFVKELFKDCKCDVVIVPACKYGMDWKKRWAFLTTWPPLLALGGRCNHAQHASLLGRGPDGSFKSGASAEYPDKLANAFALAVRPLLHESYVFVDPWTAMGVRPFYQSFRSLGHADGFCQLLSVQRGDSGIFPNGWGNPFKVQQSSRKEALESFFDLSSSLKVEKFFALHGIPLGCACHASQGCHASTLADQANRGVLSPTLPPVKCSRPCADGGGVPSSGDWRTPQSGHDYLGGLRKEYLSIIADQKIHVLLHKHTLDPTKECPVPPEIVAKLVSATVKFLQDKKIPTSADIFPGQPFRLGILHGLLLVCKDTDVSLPKLLQEGVPTGCFSPIQASGIWKEMPEQAPQGELESCVGNWMSASVDPDITQGLIDADLEQGFVKEFEGTLADAKKRWPKGVAVGKLGVAYADGRDPRLVLDSTAPGVNPCCVINEKTFNPSLHDLQDIGDLAENVTALTLDVSKAHKRVKVHDEEQGLLLFEHNGRLFYYCVCHFGAKFSAYWWARVGGCMHRLLHLLVWAAHFGFLYVDDWLWLFDETVAPLHASLVVALLLVLNCPLSWHKCKLGKRPTWIGFGFDLSLKQVWIPDDKQLRVKAFLEACMTENKMPRRDMEKGVGLLLWVSQACKLVRPWLADFYQCLVSSSPTLQGLSREQVLRLPEVLDSNFVCVKTAQGMPVCKGWKMLTLGKGQQSNLSALHAVVNPMGTTWSRWADPDSKFVQVTPAAKHASGVWQRALASSSWRAGLRPRGRAPGSAAADAFATGAEAGIGGWFSLHDAAEPAEYFWFSLSLRPSDLPVEWGMKEDAQRDIATYEMLAQVCLFWARVRHLPRDSEWELHGLSDNTPTEGAACKLFTTASPLKHAVQCMAALASQFGAFVHVSHIPGKFNDLADALSRRDWSRCSNLCRGREIAIPLQDICRMAAVHMVVPPDDHRPPALQTLLHEAAAPAKRVGAILTLVSR